MPKMRPYHPSMDFVARRAFTFGAYRYEAGDPFPKSPDGQGGWQRAGKAVQRAIPERTLRQLHDQFKIDAVAADEADADAQSPEAPVEPQEPAVDAPENAGQADVAEAQDDGSTANSEPADRDPLDRDGLDGPGGALPGNQTSDSAKVTTLPVEAKHKGFGKWSVIDAKGEVIKADMARADAEAMAADLNAKG